MTDLIKILEENWSVIQGAPIFLAVWTAVILALCWAATSGLKNNQVEDLKSRLSLRDDEIENYKRKLDGASPDEAYRKIRNLEEEIKKLKPFPFGKERLNKLIDALANVTGGAVILHDISYDDGARLASQLVHVFNTAKWRAIKHPASEPVDTAAEGMIVYVAPEGQRSEAAEAALIALRNCGFSFQLSTNLSQRKPVDLKILMTTPARGSAQACSLPLA